MTIGPPQKNNTGSASHRKPAATIALLVLCRLVLNTARRFAYPFAPALSRGLGVSLTAITSIIAANQATAIPGLVFGPLADRFGHRRMMIAGLGVLAAGMLAGGLFPVYALILAALVLAGLGKSIFDPAVQAYVSARVPYSRRGTAVGFLEFAWAGSSLVGIPLIGWLIATRGWRAPFLAMGICAVAAMGVLAACIPGEGSRELPAPGADGSRDSNSGGPQRLTVHWKRLLGERSSLGVLIFAFLVSAANDNLFVVYGAWLEKTFQVSIVALGLSTGVLGAAELTGEALTAALADRVGLKRAVVLGLVLCTLAYALLPWTGRTLFSALACLFFVFLAFEFMIVTSLSLSTELLSNSRATMMAGYFAAAGLGRVAGAVLGGPLWLAGGMALTGMVSAALNILALAGLLWGLRAWKRS